MGLGWLSASPANGSANRNFMRVAHLVLALMVSGCDLVSGLAEFSVGEPEPAGGAGGVGGAGGAGGAPPGGDILFSAVYGEQGSTRGLAIAVNKAEEIVLAGTADAEIDMGGGVLFPENGREIVVARLDHAGMHLASRLLTGVGAQEVWDIAIAADDGIIVVGTAENELRSEGQPIFDDGTAGFIVKLAQDGLDLLWERHFPGNVRVANAAVAPDGSVYICGAFDGLVTLPDGTPATSDGVDGFVSKLAADGSHLWTRSVSAPDLQEVERVAATPDGGVVVGGHFRGTVDLGLSAVTADAQDVLVAKLDGAGVPVWQAVLTGSLVERMRGVAVDADGDVAVLGTFSGNVTLGAKVADAAGDDIFVATFDEVGVFDWGTALPGTDENQQFRDPIAFDQNSDIIVTGTIVEDADFGGGVLTATMGSRDVVVAKLSRRGEHRWSHAWGAADTDLGSAVAVDAAGNSWILGSFQTAIDLNTSYVVSSQRSMFLVELGP